VAILSLLLLPPQIPIISVDPLYMPPSPRASSLRCESLLDR
jgi:hypothetical protein